MALKIVKKDTTTRKSVFWTSFILSCFFSFFILLSAFKINYSDTEKNKLKYYGALLGLPVFPLFIFLLYSVKNILEYDYIFILFAIIAVLTIILLFGLSKKVSRKITSPYNFILDNMIKTMNEEELKDEISSHVEICVDKMLEQQIISEKVSNTDIGKDTLSLISFLKAPTLKKIEIIEDIIKNKNKGD